MSYTPAPWELRITVPEDNPHRFMAWAQIRRPHHGIIETNLDDARLIAAAPELLAALERIRDLDINCSQQDDKAAWDQAHAAIAKATGQP